MEVESDRDDARERRRRVREDKLRIESGRRGGKSKSLTLRTGGTTDDGEELSDAAERDENRYKMNGMTNKAVILALWDGME